MPTHIALDSNESVLLLACLMNASDLAERTDNLDLAARALYLVDLIIDKWIDVQRRR